MPHLPSLYDELWKEFQQLTYKEKKLKLINIINSMQSDFENKQETLDIINAKGTSEDYLNKLYEIIMKTLADDFEEKKHQHLKHVHRTFQQFMEQQELLRQQEIQEAEHLIQTINNI